MITKQGDIGQRQYPPQSNIGSQGTNRLEGLVGDELGKKGKGIIRIGLQNINGFGIKACMKKSADIREWLNLIYV